MSKNQTPHTFVEGDTVDQGVIVDISKGEALIEASDGSLSVHNVSALSSPTDVLEVAREVFSSTETSVIREYAEIGPREDRCETLYCQAGHNWTREPTRGRKPQWCPEHKPDPQAQTPAEPQLVTLTCKAGHEWTREPTRGRKPEWCPEHRPVAAEPAERRTRTVRGSDDGEDGPTVVVTPHLSLEQIIVRHHPDPETMRKLTYIDEELARGRAKKDADGLTTTRDAIVRRLKIKPQVPVPA